MTNFADRTIWTEDNLGILRGLNSASVDLIYLDPPFNSNRNYAAPVGSAADRRSLRDGQDAADAGRKFVMRGMTQTYGHFTIRFAGILDLDR